MRELKLKAFHKPSKIMYWFDLMWGNNGHGNGWIGMVPFGEPMTRNSHRDNVINIDPSDCDIMQFTGLKDRNGSDIYEGDVINFAIKKMLCKPCSDKEIGVDLTYNETKFCSGCGASVTEQDFITTSKVVFSKGGFAYEWNNCESYFQSWQTFVNEIYLEWAQIIGNIHQNPELL